MAKIKTIKIQLGECVYDIVVKCNTKGMFSFDAPKELRALIKEIDDSVLNEYQSLQVLEREVSTIISNFKKAETKTRLVVMINFSARGKIVRNQNGNELPNFGYGEKFYHSGFNTDNSEIQFGYTILFEESINGKINYYNAIKVNETYDNLPQYRKIGEYIAGSYKAIRHQGDIIIPYSTETIESLQSIESQLSKAAIFLSNLLDNENLEMLLKLGNNKLLGKVEE